MYDSDTSKDTLKILLKHEEEMNNLISKFLEKNKEKYNFKNNSTLNKTIYQNRISTIPVLMQQKVYELLLEKNLPISRVELERASFFFFLKFFQNLQINKQINDIQLKIKKYKETENNILSKIKQLSNDLKEASQPSKRQLFGAFKKQMKNISSQKYT